MVFVKGTSGNPSGRPKGSGGFAQEIARQLDAHYRGKTNRETIVANAIERAREGDQRAAEWLVERVDGKVKDVRDDNLTGEVIVRVLRDRVGGAAPLRPPPDPAADPG